MLLAVRFPHKHNLHNQFVVSVTPYYRRIQIFLNFALGLSALFSHSTEFFALSRGSKGKYLKVDKIQLQTSPDFDLPPQII